jgi:hypothetical protein
MEFVPDLEKMVLKVGLRSINKLDKRAKLIKEVWKLI